jgi:hypothetical protein
LAAGLFAVALRAVAFVAATVTSSFSGSAQP